MKKSLGIGVVVVIIIGIIIVSASVTMNSTEQIELDEIPMNEEVVMEDVNEEVVMEDVIEEVVMEDVIEEVPDKEGREITVELKEKIGFKNS